MRFQEGDIVRIAKDSEYYEGTNSYNPSDINGRITAITAGDHPINVDWDNNRRNRYRDYDLKLRSRS